MTTGRINQVACRAPQAQEPSPHRETRSATDRTEHHGRRRRQSPRGIDATRTMTHRGLQHVRAHLKECSSDARAEPTRGDTRERRRQTRTGPEHRARPARPTESPLRRAKHSLAARGAQQNPDQPRTRTDVPTRSARQWSRASAPKGAQATTGNANDAAHQAGGEWELRPRARHAVQGRHAAPSSKRTKAQRHARCTRRFASGDCDRKRNRSPNQRLLARVGVRTPRTRKKSTPPRPGVNRTRNCGMRRARVRAQRTRPPCSEPQGPRGSARLEALNVNAGRRAGYPAAPKPVDRALARSLSAATRPLALAPPARPHRAHAPNGHFAAPQADTRVLR